MAPGDEYADYVEHPRYGTGPRITGIDLPMAEKTLYRNLTLWLFGNGMSPHWRITFDPDIAIPGTGVRADPAKHGNTYSSVTHYFDEKHTCHTCGRKFIFFAEEQKHWYEDLGFNLSASCDECVDCRKLSQGLRRKHRRYEVLFSIEERTDEENLELAEIAMELSEAKFFASQVLDEVRAALNQCSPECKETERYKDIRTRV